MFIESYSLKNLIKRQLSNLAEIADYMRFHPAADLRRGAHRTTMRFIRSRCSAAVSFPAQRDLLLHALSVALPKGHHVECGVYRGGSINYIAKRIAPSVIHGFDSFEGLPEKWFNIPAGHFSLEGKLPKVRSNVILHKGLFDVTLPRWCSATEGDIAFLHLDCDIYGSAKAVFDHLGPRLAEGSVILFDDYFNQPNWEADSHKAFEEFVGRSGWQVEYLGFAYKELLVRLVKAGPPSTRL